MPGCIRTMDQILTRRLPRRPVPLVRTHRSDTLRAECGTPESTSQGNSTISQKPQLTWRNVLSNDLWYISGCHVRRLVPRTSRSMSKQLVSGSGYLDVLRFRRIVALRHLPCCRGL